jgi:hypothetical protein
MKNKHEDLVVLIYADNPCYTRLVLAHNKRVGKAGVVIDREKGTWTYVGPNESAQVVIKEHKIGQCFIRPHGSRWGSLASIIEPAWSIWKA